MDESFRPILFIFFYCFTSLYAFLFWSDFSYWL